MKQISEQEVTQRRRTVQQQKEQNTKQVEAEGITIPSIAENSVENVVVNLETEGRFDSPEKIVLRQFKGRDVNNLVLSRQDKLLPTLIQILNDCVIAEEGQEEVKIENCLPQEFIEIMIGLKSKVSLKHEHKWICDCQDVLPVKEQQVNTDIIDLNTIHYVSISEADEKCREMTRPRFEMMTKEEFESYVNTHFSDYTEEEKAKITIDDALKDIHITEPIKMAVDGHIYEFRFNRMADLVFAQKEAENAFAFKFKQLQNKRWTQDCGMGMEQFKLQKEQDTDDLKDLQGRYAISVFHSLRLMKMDGQEITSLKRKIELYDDINGNNLIQLNNYLDSLRFGIYDTRDFVCPICGETKQRVLQREFNPMEFIPVIDATSGEYRHDPRCSIYFGA